MSGGSYNYLCHKTVDEIMVGGLSSLQEMADRLAQLGYADDAARETQNLLLDIRAFMNRGEAITNRMFEVWKAVEWWESCDWGETSVKEALAKYRGQESDS